MKQLTHEEVERRLPEYTTHSLSEADRIQFETHLATCPRCRRALAEWEHIAAAVQAEARIHASSLPPLRRDLFKPKEINPMTTVSIRTSRSIPLTSSRSRLPMGAILIMAVLAAAITLIVRRPEQSMFTTQIETLTPTIAQVVQANQVPLVVALRPIENGAVIRAQDLMLALIDIEYAPFSAFTDPNEVIGKIARGNIHCGEIILGGFLVENARDVPSNQGGFPAEACSQLEQFESLDQNENPVTLSPEVIIAVIAVANIQAGEIIPPERIDLRPYPADLVPQGSLTAMDAASGRIALTDLYREQLIMSDAVGMSLAADQVAISLPINQIMSLNYGIQRGSIVEIWVDILFVDIGDGTYQQLDPSMTPERRPQKLVERAEVILVMDTLVTVAISPEDANTLLWAVEARLPMEFVSATDS